MSNVLIALFIAVGAMVWVAKKFLKSTGGNSQNSYIAAAVVGLIVFLISISLLSLIP